MFTFDLARDLAGSNVAAGSSIAAYALHPATMMDTHMVTAAGARPRTTVAEGADAVVHVVTASGLESGQYFNGKRPTRAGAQAYDETARAKLRALSRELTGLR